MSFLYSGYVLALDHLIKDWFKADMSMGQYVDPFGHCHCLKCIGGGQRMEVHFISPPPPPVVVCPEYQYLTGTSQKHWIHVKLEFTYFTVRSTAVSFSVNTFCSVTCLACKHGTRDTLMSVITCQHMLD